MFRYLREELEVEVSDPSSRFPDTSSEEEIRCSYKRVWEARRAASACPEVLLTSDGPYPRQVLATRN